MPNITYVQPDGSSTTLSLKNGQSVMAASVQAGLPGIIAECGGSCSCATCQVYVDEQWIGLLEPATSIEMDLLSALEALPNVRLACQIIAGPELDGMIVHIPESANKR
jgi:2Fe-2S ferredoxin